jgi:hypothetical protein
MKLAKLRYLNLWRIEVGFVSALEVVMEVCFDSRKSQWLMVTSITAERKPGQ